MDLAARRENENQERFFAELMRVESNAVCADCGARGPKWASWNIGVFLCMRCGSLHRHLGTHISKVKALSLDKWTPEQMESIRSKGNAKVNLMYNPRNIMCSHGFSEMDLERFIRDKYERKLFMDPTLRQAVDPFTMPPGKQFTLATGVNQQHQPLNVYPQIYPQLQQQQLEQQYPQQFQQLHQQQQKQLQPQQYLHQQQQPPQANQPSKFEPEMRQLFQMGFTNAGLSLHALEISGGQMQRAIDYIIENSAPEVPATRTLQKAQPLNVYKFDHNSPAARQLFSMGFQDKHAVFNALEASGGSLEGAVSILARCASPVKNTATAHGLSSVNSQHQQQQQQQPQPQPQQIQTQDVRNFGTQVQHQPTQVVKPNSALDDLLGGLGNDPFSVHQQQHPIVAAPPQSYSPASYANNPFAAAPSSSSQFMQAPGAQQSFPSYGNMQKTTPAFMGGGGVGTPAGPSISQSSNQQYQAGSSSAKVNSPPYSSPFLLANQQGQPQFQQQPPMMPQLQSGATSSTQLQNLQMPLLVQNSYGFPDRAVIPAATNTTQQVTDIDPFAQFSNVTVAPLKQFNSPGSNFMKNPFASTSQQPGTSLQMMQNQPIQQYQQQPQKQQQPLQGLLPTGAPTSSSPAQQPKQTINNPGAPFPFDQWRQQ